MFKIKVPRRSTFHLSNQLERLTHFMSWWSYLYLHIDKRLLWKWISLNYISLDMQTSVCSLIEIHFFNTIITLFHWWDRSALYSEIRYDCIVSSIFGIFFFSSLNFFRLFRRYSGILRIRRVSFFLCFFFFKSAHPFAAVIRVAYCVSSSALLIIFIADV